MVLDKIEEIRDGLYFCLEWWYGSALSYYGGLLAETVKSWLSWFYNERRHGWNRWGCEKSVTSKSKIGSSSCLHSSRITEAVKEVCSFSKCCLSTSK